MSAEGGLDVVLVYPDLLGTYGDRGNALALRRRAQVRGIGVRIVEVEPGTPVPVSGDVYCLGGAEDSAQVLAAEMLGADGGLAGALARGAACLAVCAGFQILSASFGDAQGRSRTGLGFLDVRCGRLPGARAVGEVVAAPEEVRGLPLLSGFENHQGDAVLGPGVRPLGRLVTGVGNGDGETEGAVSGRVIGTYLHGPVLVRNPALADHLLSLAVGPLPPVDDELVERLRRERLAAAQVTRPGGRAAWVPRPRARVPAAEQG